MYISTKIRVTTTFIIVSQFGIFQCETLQIAGGGIACPKNYLILGLKCCSAPPPHNEK